MTTLFKRYIYLNHFRLRDKLGDIDMLSLLCILGIGMFVLIALVLSVMAYNNLIRVRKNIDRAEGNIDALLKQRNDELPKLIDTVKQYIDYERGVMKEITEARTRAENAQGHKEEAEADKAVRSAFGNLFAVAEEYPELKANEEFNQLQRRISSIEEQIADRREFFNDATVTYNARIEQIPYVFFAKILGYEEKELFEATEEEKKDINVAQLFNE